MITAKQIIQKLNLAPLPQEGGYYSETYRSNLYINKHHLGDAYSGDRIFYSTIYYMLTVDTFSAIHQLPGDEIFHFYMGDTVEMLQLHPDGSGEMVRIGNDIMHGIFPQKLVKGGTWQGSRLREGGSFALMGTTMSPGFEFEDYQHGKQDDLVRAYPDFEGEILKYF